MARCGLLGLGLLLGACSSNGPPIEGATTASGAATTPTGAGGPAAERIGSCLLADLTIGPGPRDGAGGRSVDLISFRNDGTEPCELTDPTAVQTSPATDPPIERGRLFFPVERFEGELAPGSAAFIELESTACVSDGGSSIESVTVSFEGDVAVTVPWAVASTCGTRWEGFVSWR